MTDKPIRWDFSAVSEEEWRAIADAVVRLAESGMSKGVEW